MPAPPYAGRVTTAARRPTSADVAARAGVSRATVSMVLNGRTEGTVSAANQKKVLDAAAELGYTRSAVAMSLRERRTRTIGLISDEIATSPWAGRMVRAASMAAAERGYMVLTADLSLREATVEDAVRMLAERQVDGLVYAAMGRVRITAPTPSSCPARTATPTRPPRRGPTPRRRSSPTTARAPAAPPGACSRWATSGSS